MARGVILVIVAATVYMAAVPGSSTGSVSRQPSTKDLHAAVRSLIPASMRLISRKDAACGEGLRYPSCTDVNFRLSGSLQQRIAAFVRPARRHGWSIFRHCSFAHLFVSYKMDRGAFTANVTFVIANGRGDHMEVLAYHDHDNTARARRCP